MASEEQSHDEQRRRAKQLRDERKEDTKEAVREVLKEELGPMLTTVLWSDMRPARRWEDVRTFLENEMKEGEGREARRRALKERATETAWDFGKDILKHLIVSTGLGLGAWQIVIHLWGKG